jgi:hypothetical protein
VDDAGLDIDDLVGIDEPANDEMVAARKFEAWLSVDRKPQHKLIICRDYSNPSTVALSRDRLKSVHGFTKYNEPSHHLKVNLTTADDAQSMLAIQNPALTLVRCNNMTFLTGIQLLDL